MKTPLWRIPVRILRRAPWWSLSIAINACLVALCMQSVFLNRTPASGPPVLTSVEGPVGETLDECIPSDLIAGRPIEQDDRVLEDPVISDAKVSDYNETDNQAPYEESLGSKDFISDAPLKFPSTNASIGIGGGAAGSFGGRNLMAKGGGTAEEFHREGYDSLDEAGWRDALRAPLSTFGIDVDTASYSNVRRILREGRMPPAGAVRIEELINYFGYDYAPPTDQTPFSVTTEVADCPWNPGHRLVHIGLKGRVLSEDGMPPRNLVFLLDVSGSMRSKLPLVKTAMRMLVSQLTEDDRVAIVVYAGASGLVLDATRGDDRRGILDAIERLQAGGSTNGGQGIRLAYSVARKNRDPEAINRVILATDGDFNVGTTSRSELKDLIEKERENGVFLTVLGVGRGNIQDSQMEMLADHGNGNYAYLDSAEEAKKVLCEELGSTLVTIAKDVKIQVEFNPERVGAYRLIGYENRTLAARDFNDDKKDAGEIGAAHSVTALYEITPPGENPDPIGTDPLKYQVPRQSGGESWIGDVLTLKLRYKEPDGDTSTRVEFTLADPGNRSVASASRDFRFSAAVAAWGMLLRDSKHAGEADHDLVSTLAHGALGDDPHGHRRAFLELVETSDRISSRSQ